MLDCYEIAYGFFAQVAERVKGLHSYEVPEVLAVPIVEGSKAYLDWMSGVLKLLNVHFCTDKP